MNESQVYANHIEVNPSIGFGDSNFIGGHTAFLRFFCVQKSMASLWAGRVGTRKSGRCACEPVRQPTRFRSPCLATGEWITKPTQVIAAMTIYTQTPSVIPFQFNNTEVRVIEIDNQIWFVASDVATVLKYRDALNLVRILDNDEKDTHIVSTLGGDQEVTIINESGFYHAVLKSRKPEAKPLRKWVTSEVLPAIRKTGKYETPNLKTKKSLPNGLTLDQCDAVKSLVRARVEALPKEKQAKAAITCWSALKSKFGCSYKAIEPAHFSEALSLVARLPLEGELLPREKELPVINAKSCLIDGLPELRHQLPLELSSAIDKKSFSMALEAYELCREYLARQIAHKCVMGNPSAINTSLAITVIDDASLGKALTHKFHSELDQSWKLAKSVAMLAAQYCENVTKVITH